VAWRTSWAGWSARTLGVPVIGSASIAAWPCINGNYPYSTRWVAPLRAARTRPDIPLAGPPTSTGPSLPRRPTRLQARSSCGGRQPRSLRCPSRST
jgi:hypothetical protein